MEVKLINYTTNPVAAIEEAATTCYDSQPTDGRIMRHCYKSGHHSVLEFADFTFRIKGVSRALTHQLVRHRMASFAQRSQRKTRRRRRSTARRWKRFRALTSDWWRQAFPPRTRGCCCRTPAAVKSA